jgi:hypothetical protein
VKIRNILYCVAVAALLGGCANQALAEEAPAVVPSSSPSKVVPSPSPSPSPSSKGGWAEPASYKFTLTSSCDGLIGRFRSTVLNGMVTQNEGLDADSRKALMLHLSRLVPTLGDLEARAETAKTDGTPGVVIEVDPTDGHPTSITINHHACYQISDYSVG